MTIKTVFVAKDGEVFSTEERCREHESNFLPRRVRRIKSLGYGSICLNPENEMFVFSPCFYKHCKEFEDWCSNNKYSLYYEGIDEIPYLFDLLMMRKKYLFIRNKNEKKIYMYDFNNFIAAIKKDINI